MKEDNEEPETFVLLAGSITEKAEWLGDFAQVGGRGLVCHVTSHVDHVISCLSHRVLKMRSTQESWRARGKASINTGETISPLLPKLHPLSDVCLCLSVAKGNLLS